VSAKSAQQQVDEALGRAQDTAREYADADVGLWYLVGCLGAIFDFDGSEFSPRLHAAEREGREARESAS
jgi:hypothetical protein